MTHRKATMIASLAALTSALAGCTSQAAERPRGATAALEAEHAGDEMETGTMMVIRVLVQVREGEADAFLAHMREETPRVLALEGCERYAVFAEPGEPNRFLLYEEWASEEAFAAYQASELLAESFRVLGPMMAGPPDSSYFAARAVGP